MTLLGGRYLCQHLLAEGGTSSVFHGHDRRLGRPVAIKVGSISARGAEQEFRRQVGAAARLTHPRIAAVHDLGGGEGTGEPPWAVLELVPGPSLQDVIAGGGAPPGGVALVVDEVLDALEHAHAHDILHGDLCPGNVLLGADGSVKLIDFALGARRLPVRPGHVVGTPGYVPPERGLGHAETQRSDLYAAGCLLYALVTGAPPFPGDDPARAIADQARTVAPPLALARPDVPPAWDAFLQQALARDPADRFVSAARMRAELARLPDLPTGAAPPQGPARPRTRVLPLGEARGPRAATRRRAATETDRRSGSWAVALLAVAAIVVGGLAIVERRGQPAAAAAGTGDRSSWTVPLLQGRTVPDAAAQLRATGLAAGPTRAQPDPSAPPGVVVGTEPEVGADVGPGGRVTLLVSSGPAGTTIPPVVGQDLRRARELLSAGGLQLGELTRRPSPAPLDTVLSVRPAAGSPVATGQRVDLELASGATALPDVVGLSAADAVASLQRAGLGATTRTTTGRPDLPGGTVTQAGAPAGSLLLVGSTVVLVVTEPRTPAPASSTPPVGPSPTTWSGSPPSG